MALKQKRNKGLKVLMTETTYNRLVELSELLGQTPSTLASLGVSNLVNQYMGQIKVQDAIAQASVSAIENAAAQGMELAK